MPGDVQVGQRRTVVAAHDGNCRVTGGPTIDCWGFASAAVQRDAPDDRPGADFVVIERGVPRPGDIDAPFCIVMGRGEVECRMLGAWLPRPSLRPATDIAVGVDHACAVLTDPREVVCWALTASPAAPLPQVVTDARDVVVGRAHACAVDGRGEVTCWGFDGCPTAGLPGLGAVTGLAAYDDTCAVSRDGRVHCWPGDSCPARDAPEGVPAVANIQHARLVATGPYVNCSVSGRGSVTCWAASRTLTGRDGEDLGRPLLAGQYELPTDHSIQELTIGSAHACARTTAGKHFCWGRNNHRQVDGPRVQEVVATPHGIAGLGPVAEVTVASDMSCARQVDGEIVCWGELELGEWSGTPQTLEWLKGARLGETDDAGVIDARLDRRVFELDAQSARKPEFELPPTLGLDAANTASRLVRAHGKAGEDLVCARRGAEDVVCVEFKYGLPGEVTYTYDGVADFAVCSERVLHVDRAGVVTCEHLDDDRPGRHAIDLGSPAAQIDCNEVEACARLADGSVHCWLEGEALLALPSDEILPPTKMALQRAAVGLALGPRNACAWDRDGRLECWASRGSVEPEYAAALQLGTRTAPRAFDGLQGVTQMSLSHRHACAVLASGEVRCWGDNRSGQSGVGFGGIVRTPVEVELE